VTYDPSSSPPLPRNMRLKQVLEVFPISKSSLYAKMKASSPYFDSTFPQPFYLPKSRIPLWRAAEI
jgi:predicted DNA-binding transcriptional regulator AlpA